MGGIEGNNKCIWLIIGNAYLVYEVSVTIFAQL
ncbi:hypothetical protein SAMN05421821_11896 [Mucilaginibacter lappiensis]|uniref:Uncharacterized protein n=1 Tax=Mucilaginibacter lappiensis TaxID=354630 RepID=A0ABR6PRL0_9SPHI|nr:hypothetical protein [Mucilaginibacter lappiensis]SIS01255.1 hypothetical protein SAMN05421821_11896 [Mucilaginibacter lappiensis]